MTHSWTLSYNELTRPKSWLIHVRQAMACLYISSNDKHMYSKPWQCLNPSWIWDYTWRWKFKRCHHQENCRLYMKREVQTLPSSRKLFLSLNSCKWIPRPSQLIRKVCGTFEECFTRASSKHCYQTTQKNHKLVTGNPFQRFSSGILVLMWKLGISGIEANKKKLLC